MENNLTDYIEVIVCLFQIVLFQFISTPLFRNVTYKISLNRNKKWVAENPDILINMPIPNGKTHIIFGIIFAILSVASLWNKEYIHIHHIHSASAFLMLFHYLAIDLVLFNKMGKLIPRGVRTANMKARSLKDHANNWQIILPLILLLGNLFLWGNHFLSIEEYSNKDIFNLVLHFVALIIVFISIWYIVRRPPISNDLKIDDAYRSLEFKTTYYVLISALILKLITYVRVSHFNSNEVLLFIKSADGLLPLTMYAVFLYFASRTFQKISDTLNET